MLWKGGNRMDVPKMFKDRTEARRYSRLTGNAEVWQYKSEKIFWVTAIGMSLQNLGYKKV